MSGKGVTTLIEGPDGSSPVPLGPFLAKLEALQKSVNVGAFIGQGSIRSRVIGELDRQATADELQQMRALVEQGMKDGAFGLSTGLFYVPGTFTPTDEVVELAKVAGRFGGIHISHMRDETAKVLDSVNETIAIGERGGLPTQVTHHKIIGRPNWGKSVETLKAVDEARARGVDVTIDAYPYTASSTSIQGALFPAWAQEGGRKQVLARLADPAIRPEDQGRHRARDHERARRRRSEEHRGRLVRVGRGAGRPEPERGGQGSAACSRQSTMPPKRRCGWCRAAAVRASSTPSARRISNAFSSTRRR